MTRGEPVFADPLLDLRRQFKQAQDISNRRAIPAHPSRDLFLCKPKLDNQTFVGPGFLNRVEILSLEVFNQGHFQGTMLLGFADNSGNSGQTRPLRCAPAALPGDQLKNAVLQRTDDDGLEHPKHTN